MTFNHLVCITSVLVIFACKPPSYDEPVISLEDYHIEDGFELQVAASEPFLEAPVAMDFDNQGRIWVVEMKGYMQDVEGTDQDAPIGRISILEDLDNDGVADHSKVFLDKLVLPRAIAHVYGGLLYAEPPNLWFVNIEDDKPVNKVLVDSLYSVGGNVEHQPNGLMMHIDNWIYSAKSNFRYQKKGDKWLKEPTSFRGQWGISRDNFGRLYYNNNSNQLIGDYVLPNSTIKNEYIRPNYSINNTLTTNQRVYPLHATSVNRGYSEGILDKDSLLVNVTAACGPLIYRGNKYPDTYEQNAFVCVPEANLVKRNILSFEGDRVIAEQAWNDKEFIASTDEGFRPVNLLNGPDGNMFIVDMHRGIIQDKAFLSPYLKEQLTTKQLDTIIGMGRILKVVSEPDRVKEVPDIENSTTSELVRILKSSNGWQRDRAQQLLLFRDDRAAIPKLKSLSLDVSNPLAQIHALHTLNGFDALSFDFLEGILLSESNPMVLLHSLVLIEPFAVSKYMLLMADLSKQLMLRNDPEIDLYLTFSLGSWVKLSPKTFFPILGELLRNHEQSAIYHEGVVNSLRDSEQAFKVFLEEEHDAFEVPEVLKNTIKNKTENKKNSIFVSTTIKTDSRTAGYGIYKNLCAACHGIDGKGIETVAPPLRGSEYVEGAVDRLALIILHGLEGPVHVNGERYEFNGIMPGLANNPEFNDEDIANVISYVQNAFTRKADHISPDRIRVLRDQKPAKGHLFTEEELLKLGKQEHLFVLKKKGSLVK